MRAVPPADEPDHETSTLSEHSDDSLVHQVPSLPALVLLWLADEPDRTGEVCLIPAGEPWGSPRVFGRGESRADDLHRRVHLQRQQGAGSPTAVVITNRRISRSQLVLRAQSSGRIAVENHGRCHAYRNGERFESAELEPGDVLRLGQQMSFLCVRRPVWAQANDAAPREFGRADAHGLVGESTAMRELRANVRAAAAATGHVLLLGETGTGKELVARALHAEAFGRDRPFVARNAATLPESLIDAELFGNARNYPNAGMPERPGLIGQAHRGSLFLDEFGELSRALQVHLLRVLDDGEYQRLGESSSRRSEFRLIAATNRPVEVLRDDVLARFKTRVVVPALSERREDIPLIARHVLGERGAELPLAFIEKLVCHDYVGNVRELQALLSRYSSDPHFEAWEETWRTTEPANAVDPASLTRERIEECLEQHAWVQEKVWRALGLSSRHALARLLRKYDIAGPGSGTTLR